MKIGLYGGMANNMYVLAKTLVKNGLNIIYIRDIFDKYPFSQPFWEDISTKLSYNEIDKFKNKTWEEIYSFEKKNNWIIPDWLVDPNLYLDTKSNISILNYIDIIEYVKNKKKFVQINSIINLMRQCDILIVCGINAAIFAYLSRKPYIIWPHGGDIRIAAGLQISKNNNLIYRILSYKNYIVLKKAYKKSRFICTQDPTCIGGHIGDVSNIVGDKMKLLPIPLIKRKNLGKNQRKIQFIKLIKELNINIPIAEYIIFIPSRIDFFWKGQNLILNAVKNLSLKKKIHFIFSGWGKDYLELRESFPKEISTFLPFVLSKPLLYKFFSCVDLVIDQFFMGTYGTSAIEAMSCGTAVMMRINNKAFFNKNWTPPPVVNVETSKDIYNAFKNILSNNLDLIKIGNQSMNWINEVHHDAVVTKRIVEYIKLI